MPTPQDLDKAIRDLIFNQWSITLPNHPVKTEIVFPYVVNREILMNLHYALWVSEFSSSRTTKTLRRDLEARHIFRVYCFVRPKSGKKEDVNAGKNEKDGMRIEVERIITAFRTGISGVVDMYPKRPLPADQWDIDPPFLIELVDVECIYLTGIPGE